MGGTQPGGKASWDDVRTNSVAPARDPPTTDFHTSPFLIPQQCHCTLTWTSHAQFHHLLQPPKGQGYTSHGTQATSPSENEN